MISLRFGKVTAHLTHNSGIVQHKVFMFYFLLPSAVYSSFGAWSLDRCCYRKREGTSEKQNCSLEGSLVLSRVQVVEPRRLYIAS